jgi:crotonobetainyl-CoA:carnitine CoA-transferase CaiB-like acyl-CoA transferase
MDDAAALEPYRILDLTTHRGWLAGKMLADLGAAVIKIEPPGGDPGRWLGPFAGDAPDPEGSLAWWAYNRGKSSATLDLQTPEGRERFLELAAGADAVIESFDPGGMEAWGLGLSDLLEVNPSLVLTRITAFGQTGPYARHAASDLTVVAAGGAAWVCGDDDRAPLRVTAPQAFLHASAEAALHTVVGLLHGARTGEGQQIDVSAQTAVIRTLMDAFTHAYADGVLVRRRGLGKPAQHSPLPSLFRSADGLVLAFNTSGLASYRDWARDEGDPIPDFFQAISEEHLAARGVPAIAKSPELVSKLAAWLAAFCAKRTRAAIVAGGMQRRIMTVGVNTLADVLADEQLEVRNYYQLAHPCGRQTPARHPSVWAHLTRTPLLNTAGAPRIGEHTDAVFTGAAEAAARRRAPGTAARTGDVFAGLKVWDSAWVGAGPLTTRYLGDYGATVVRTESSRSHDSLRRLGPYKDGIPGLNRSQFFAEFNPSKLGMGVNFATPEGHAVGLKLAAWADVVVESFSPGVMDRFGLGYEALRDANPSIIMLSTSMNGQTGPRRKFSGFGAGLAAMAGFVDLTGWPDRTPATPYGAYTDFIVQRFCGTALVAALDHRRRTGEGQYIDVSQYEASAQFLAPFLLDAEVNGRVRTRDGNRDLNFAPHGVFRCQGEGDLDRWVAIAVETEAQWAAFVRRIGSPAWASDSRFASFEGRKANEDALEALVGAWTADKTATQVVERLQPEVPAALVQTGLDLLEDPQLLHRGYLRTLHHAEVGDIPYEGSQVLASATQPWPRKAAPVFAGDTLQVLRDFLGYAPDEIDALISKGAVESSKITAD